MATSLVSPAQPGIRGPGRAAAAAKDWLLVDLGLPPRSLCSWTLTFPGCLLPFHRLQEQEAEDSELKTH